MGGATNCPETPRQKMIGMMYLVLTAMLALNVSAAILNGYTQVDESLHATIETMEQSNADTYATFKVALEKNAAKTQEWYDKAMEVQKVSNEFYAYVQKFKDDMVKMVDGDKAKMNAKVSELGKQDDTNIPQQYAINEGNAKTNMIGEREVLYCTKGEVEEPSDIDIVLLRHNGDLFSSCDLSYDSMDEMSKSRDRAFIGNINENSLNDIFEDFCK